MTYFWVSNLFLHHSLFSFKEKMERLNEKRIEIQKEQQSLIDNLTKFNTFVNEKNLKVEQALKTENEEKKLKENIIFDIENKEQMVMELSLTKEFMFDNIQNRKIFRNFLQNVVDCDEAKNRYKDIPELIKRCETLVDSRNNLLELKKKLCKSIQMEEDEIRNYKEEQNEHILDLK